MDGLLLKLLDDHNGSPGRWFWRLFLPIRADLDRLFWCFSNQPWMGAPDGFDEDEMEPFDERCQTSIQLWRPGALGRYAEQFAEEWIELWAIEPTRDDPARVATAYSNGNWSEEILREHARVWLIYTCGTCWEIYARKADLIDRVAGPLQGRRSVEVVRGRSERRDELYGRAGLADVWRANHGLWP